MFRRLSTTERMATVIAASAIAAFAVFLTLRLKVAPTYPDFIVGSLAWYAGTKFQDLLAAPVFVAAFLLSLWVLSGIICQINERASRQDKAEVGNQMLWWFIPLAVTMGGLIMGPLLGQPVNNTLFYIFVTGALAVSIILGHDLWRGRKLSPPIVGLAIMGVLLSALIPLEIALVLGRAPVRWVGEINISQYGNAAYYLVVVGVLVVMVLEFRLPERLRLWMPRFLLIGQIGLPFLFLTLYPARLATPDGEITKYATSGWLKVWLLGMLLWGVADVLWRYRKYHKASAQVWTTLLSPIAIFGLIVVFVLGNTVSPQIPPDDYHFGEWLLGWWSYLNGKTPYVDYIPAHGLVDDWAGILSFMFYDGTAATILDANRIGMALLALAAYLSIFRLSGSLGLAFISILFLVKILFSSYGGRVEWLFLVPFLCIWLSKSLRARPARWLAVWLLTAPVVILVVPPQGLLLVVASTVIAFRTAWLLWVHRENGRLWEIGVSVSLLLFCALLMPLLPMLLGAVRYVFENGPINQVAYGIPLGLSWNAEGKFGLVAQVIFEAVRMSWVAVPLISLVIILSNFKERSRWESLIPAVVVFLFSIFLIPYSMGRVDPGYLSRPGLAAIFGWTVLIPVAAWPLIKPSNRLVFIAVVALAGALLNYGSLYSLSFSSLVSAVSAKTAIGTPKDGKSAGLPNIGRAVVQDDHWNRLTRLNTLLAKRLSPGETYLDLSSHHAQYFYLNRQPATAVTAPYNMVPLPQQQRAVADLSRNLPRMALLEANNIVHDGGGLALRDPLLYRFVVDNYMPAWENGFVVGYRKQDSHTNEIQSIQIPIKNLTDVDWDKGVHRREAAIVLSDPAPLSALSVGTQVLLGNGDHRHITRIRPEGSAIWLDGPIFDSSKIGAPNFIEATVEPKAEPEFKLALLDKAFSTLELAKIPVAWGKSEASLIKRMNLVQNFDSISPALYDLSVENGAYKIVGNDPRMSFDISNYSVSGRNAGLLKFEFSCLSKNSEPRIQVFWWGDEQMGPTEAASLRFTAENGVLIVPVDAYPRWLTLGKIRGVRIDLDNASACGGITVRSVALYQRKIVLE